MAVYNTEAKLSDVLISHPSLIPVADRFGVRLGVGDYSIEEICSSLKISPQFFLCIINTFIDEDYFPIYPEDVFSLEKTVDYLEKTGNYYQQVQLPNISKHFNLLISRSNGENSLSHIYSFFEEVRSQFEQVMDNERDSLFPKLRRHEYDEVSREGLTEQYVEIEDKLQDLLIFFIVHLKGSYDSNLCTGVVSAIYALKKDMKQNNRIRRRIFLPLVNKFSQQ